MTVLHFLYRMELKYEKHIGRCYFTIKCLPREDDRQHVLNTELFVLPKTTYSFGEDSFGNRQIYGCEHEDHNLFVFQISGDVEILQTDYEEKNRQEVTGLFQVPHGKCIPGGELLNYFHSLDFKECETSFQVCEKLMHGLHQDFSYVPGTTDVNTTAEEAWKQGKGVCQDYAHIYVTLLRLAGIPARYVCGLIIGEGASHAWAEVLIDGFWVPFDPTNDCLVWDHYIKLGHGRDAADCAINRGLMWNGGAQSQDISVLVENGNSNVKRGRDCMVSTIAAVGLPIDETLEIRKNRIFPENPGENMKRISIVTGIHGDELEGQYVCYELQRRIEENRECLKGIVDIYPAMNPLGMDSITRGIPSFDLDLNRMFPGDIDGSMMEYVVARMMEDVAGSDCVFDIHASNIYLTEIPQIRINELHQEKLVPMAEESNVDFIWVHGANTVLESTFAYSLNNIGTPVLVVEMGVGMRITQEYGNQLTDGIFHLMKKMGIWTGEVKSVRKPVVSRNPEDVFYLNARVGGVFLPKVSHGAKLKKGELIGYILDPLNGKILDNVEAEEEGMLFTIREYPIVLEGSLMGRILKKEVWGCE